MCLIVSAFLCETGFAQAKKPIHSLKDIEILVAAVGEWSGVGVSFDIKDGELGDPVTVQDDWEATFKKDGKVLEMSGMVRQAGVELPYLWTFNFSGDRDTITATYEMPDVKDTLGVKLIADGKRVQLFPIPGKSRIHMEIDIYEENGDLIIETRLKNAQGDLVYRSATRYQLKK